MFLPKPVPDTCPTSTWRGHQQWEGRKKRETHNCILIKLFKLERPAAKGFHCHRAVVSQKVMELGSLSPLARRDPSSQLTYVLHALSEPGTLWTLVFVPSLVSSPRSCMKHLIKPCGYYLVMLSKSDHGNHIAPWSMHLRHLRLPASLRLPFTMNEPGISPSLRPCSSSVRLSGK